MENKPTRQPYPGDISDEEWAFVEPFFALIRPDAGQRVYEMREILNAVRWIARTGAQWRYLLHDLPPWPLVYQQMRRWMEAGSFEDLLKALLATDTRGNPLALTASPADEQDREQVGELLEKTQVATENHVEVAFADQGYPGEEAAAVAQAAGVEWVVIKLAEPKNGFVLLPRRWVVEIV